MTRADAPGDAASAMPGRDLVLASAIGLVACFLFRVLVYEPFTDYPAHAVIAAAGNATGRPYGHFLFFVASSALAGFSTDPARILVAFPVVLALATAAKFGTTVWFVRCELRHPSGRRPLHDWLVTLAGLALLVAFSLPTAGRPPFSGVYLGQFPTTVWHNSTTIFLMPFAVAAFALSWRYIENGSVRLLWLTAVWLFAGLAAKPAVAPAFVLVLPAWVLASSRSPRQRLAAIALSLALAVTLGVQARYIFTSDISANVAMQFGRAASGPRGVVLQPFRVWNYFSADWSSSLLASFAFPLLAAIALPRRILTSKLVAYAASYVVVTLGAFVLLAERGPSWSDANFAWGVMAATYFLFLACVIELLRAWSERGWRPFDIAPVSALVLHTVAGIAVISRMARGVTIFTG